MKVCLVSHTENFRANRGKYYWLIKEFEKLEKKLGKKIPITWTLEEDDTKPFSFEIRAGNEGDVISKGAEFFKKLKKKGHELGVHVHFVKKNKVDFFYDNQKRLIKNAKKKFVSTFGFNPKSFVGGWWHSDKNTAKILEEEGFLIDASPMPLYTEKRRKWIFGKIPTPFRIKACDWSDFKSRTPIFLGKILNVPNAVDPKINKFSIEKSISLDMLDVYLDEFIQAFKNFKFLGIDFLCIPFHPNYLTRKKVEKIHEFLIECDKIEKLKFLRLEDIYKIYKNKKNV